MTTYNKATLKTYFENGDVPAGSDYANFIDSYVNIVETAEQVMAGALNVTELIASRVSAANLNVIGIISAATISVDSLSTPIFTASAATITNSLSVGGKVSAASLNVTGDVSAGTGTIYASAMRSTNGILVGVGIVSAAGTAQATGASLVNVINRAKGVVDGQTTGFVIPANRTGLTQIIYNDSVSANLWPPTGGQINALSVNAAFPMAANIPYAIYHITSSAYAVK